MAEAQLRRHVRSDRRCAVALRRMVTAGTESHAHLPGQMRLGLRDFAGDDGLRAGGHRRLKLALRTAAAPGNLAQGLARCGRSFDAHHLATQGR